ncbi:hypothetical protein LZC95_11025 [Pendulispora brunnea]|uniref:Peptidase M48 domain-containing protein n=1 Tax=Pendulispora brunnea TaxID=2905690 RepID=A0ABZ2KF94_9BACT
MTGRAETFIHEMKEEFPTFEILKKRDSAMQRSIHRALMLLTLGRMRTYLTQYHTVLFGKLWVPDSFDTMSDADRYILLRHERVHLRQRRRMGDITMAFVYLIPFFPLGLAYGRARIEWEAYTETIRATYEVFGLPHAKLLRKHIVDRFAGPDYGWMWPFRRAVGRWFDDVIADLAAESASQG